MAEENALEADCRLLGIEAGSRPGEIERAWRELKSVYAADSLAGYGLFDEAGRQERLEELESAYGRIIRRQTRPEAKQPPSAAPQPKEVPTKLTPAEPAGKFLRTLRENAGLSLKDVASKTKISPMRLDQIEQEMFERLPAAVYLRGFVLEYAKALGCPQPQEVAVVYLSRYQDRVKNGQAPD